MQANPLDPKLVELLDTIAGKMTRLSDCNEPPVWTDGYVLKVADEETRNVMLQIACLCGVTMFNVLAGLSNLDKAISAGDVTRLQVHRNEIDDSLLEAGVLVVALGGLLGIDEGVEMMKEKDSE